MDGAVQTGDLYFGASSSYFTNLYPGLFVLVAHNVNSIDNFSIDGNLGADSNGYNNTMQFHVNDMGEVEIMGSSPSNIQYSVFVRRVYDTGDPSILQIFIVDNPDELLNYQHDIDFDNEDDQNILTFNGIVPDKISYLLLSKYKSIEVSDDEVYEIVKKYIELTHGKDINSVLSTLSNEYSQIVDVLNENIRYSTKIKIFNFEGEQLESLDLDGYVDEVHIAKDRIAFISYDEESGDDIWVYSSGSLRKVLNNVNLLKDNDSIVNDNIYND